jgi:hypothetical protein
LHSIARDLVRTEENDLEVVKATIATQVKELHDYLGNPTYGWRHLRTLVRACGMALMTRLIRTEVMDEYMPAELSSGWAESEGHYFLDIEEEVRFAVGGCKMRSDPGEHDPQERPVRLAMAATPVGRFMQLERCDIVPTVAGSFRIPSRCSTRRINVVLAFRIVPLSVKGEACA